MVTVCPESVSFQLPSTEPSTTNPGHTATLCEILVAAYHGFTCWFCSIAISCSIRGVKVDPIHNISSPLGYTISTFTVTELVVQNLHPVALYAKVGGCLLNCPNLVGFISWLYSVYSYANLLPTLSSRVGFDLKRGALQIKCDKCIFYHWAPR
eukprot:sb/3473341/